jgi:hypothetical protein
MRAVKCEFCNATDKDPSGLVSPKFITFQSQRGKELACHVECAIYSTNIHVSADIETILASNMCFPVKASEDHVKGQIAAEHVTAMDRVCAYCKEPGASLQCCLCPKSHHIPCAKKKMAGLEAVLFFGKYVRSKDSNTIRQSSLFVCNTMHNSVRSNQDWKRLLDDACEVCQVGCGVNIDGLEARHKKALSSSSGFQIFESLDAIPGVRNCSREESCSVMDVCGHTHQISIADIHFTDNAGSPNRVSPFTTSSATKSSNTSLEKNGVAGSDDEDEDFDSVRNENTLFNKVSL